MKVIYHLVGIAIVALLLIKSEGEFEHFDDTGEHVTAHYQPTARPSLPEEAQPVLAAPRPAADDGVEAAADAAASAIVTSTFMGQLCLQNDCAADLAGYHWAEENGINEPSVCDSLGGELSVGCSLYAGMEQQYNL